MKSKRYYIKDLEKALHVCRDTYYYWEETGKVPLPRREPMSGYRYWTHAELNRLKKITGR